MSRDPIRALIDRQNDTKRALSDGHYAQAVMARNAPTVAAFIAALDAGHEGEAALTAAHEIDQAAANFTPPPAA